MKLDELLASSEPSIALADYAVDRERRESLSKLPTAVQLVYRIEELEMEVNNGGLHQYFFNSEGDGGQDVSRDLETVGASYTAQIVRDAMSVFPKGIPPKNRFKRQNELLGIGKEKKAFLDKLDQKFYEYKDRIGDLVIAYAIQHKSQFE